VTEERYIPSQFGLQEAQFDILSEDFRLSVVTISILVWLQKRVVPVRPERRSTWHIPLLCSDTRDAGRHDNCRFSR